MSSAESALGRCEMTTTMDLFWRMIPMARVKAFSPSASRLALGSSSTSRNGSPNTARARPTRCFWPADSDMPPCPIRVA